MLQSGGVVDQKKKLQAFFTPPDLAMKMAAWAGVNRQQVLEPSAGHGSLADACMLAGATAVTCVEINPEFASVLRPKVYRVHEADFLGWSTPVPFDRIVMNPPFAKNQDIAHVHHALKFLAPGGILVAIMSPNLERPRMKALLDGLDHEITDIEAGAFKQAGTTIRTIAIRIHQPRR